MRKIIALFLLITNLLLLGSCSPTEGSDDGANEPHVCEFDVEEPKAKYIKTRSTCTQLAEYYYSCSCGAIGEETFYYGDYAGHVYSKNVDEIYLAKEATVKTSAVYYKSCSCGHISDVTFEHGETLELTEDQRLHLPMSVTVSIFDAQNCIYGFTYNTLSEPIDPVIQFKRSGENTWTEYAPTSYSSTTYDADGSLVTYYISKAEVTLLPDTSYVYRVCDKGADVATPEVNFVTKRSDTDSFTFAHVSDSQAGPTEFGWVMESVSASSDFVLHGGDVVQYAQYEHEWRAMLDDNYESVMSIPIMAITGNHETSYNNATYEIEKHFNNNIPTQTSTALGYYYSFVYGNVKFIMLNTNDLTSENKLKDEQYNWLIGELQSNTCKWIVVTMHNPMYSVGKYGADETRNAIAMALRDQLQGVFAQYGVDLVLQGHDHAISRTYPIDENGAPKAEAIESENGIEYIVDPDGVIYLMNGPAGTQSRAPVEIDETLYAYAESSKKGSWAEITVTGDSLTVTVKWHDGSAERVYHTWGIKK